MDTNEVLNESMMELAKARTIAKMLDTPERTIRDWVHKGVIPHVKLGRGPKAPLRFHVPTIRKWIASQTVTPISCRV